MTTSEPNKLANAFRISLNINFGGTRLDSALMEALRAQDENAELKTLSRAAFKDLFKNKRIQIKGQNAKPASELSKGITYIDILGFGTK